ncbi:MAG: homoserine O-succinyltransferase [Oscillospiraceae bacterium]|nr:homoserine O-succinyltransferase [Oscillospiraceae bacterium]
MPIKIPNTLPARLTLESENIFVMTETRARHQDIRPLKIAILNLMPTKITTETQFLRLLGNTPLHVEITLLQAATHAHKNTSKEHLLAFYKSFDDVKYQWFDGLIITGAPVEKLPFPEVDYWAELCRIMNWSKTNVFSTMHICWGAQAGLFYHHGVKKYLLERKKSGVYLHRCLAPSHPIMRGFDDEFYMPHSRYTGILRSDVERAAGLEILADSPEAGAVVIANSNYRRFYITGHCEYDRNTLLDEYKRDAEKGLDIEIPANYFPANDPETLPVMLWRAHASLLASNWLNFVVYEHTPYDLTELSSNQPFDPEYLSYDI